MSIHPKWSNDTANREFSGTVAAIAAGMCQLTSAGALLFVHAVYVERDKGYQADAVKAFMAECLTETLAYKDRAARAYLKDMLETARFLIAKFGRPDVTEANPFWGTVYEAETFLDSVRVVAAELARMGADTQARLQCLIYDKPEKAKATPAPKATHAPASADGATVVEPDAEEVLTREYVLAAMLALDPEDAAWVMEAYLVAAATAARNVTAPAIAAA